jgi:DNA-binding transcriptional regulator LsrR (DeoR family)
MPNEIWYSDGVNKQEICDELNISRAALEKMLSSLTERKLLVKISRGKYTLSNELKEDY